MLLSSLSTTMPSDIVKTITESIIQFITEMGGAFLLAFQKIFMNETTTGVYEGLNPLGIFLLVFFGIALGYGVIRWITGLFRRQFH